VRKIALRITCLFLLGMGLIDCSRGPGAENTPNSALTKEPPPTSPVVAATNADQGQLFGRIWRISKVASAPASGSIYIFLSNGTLLETSCVETYRVATWTADKKEPGVLQIVEDHRPAFTAKIMESTDKTLRLQQTLLMGNKESRELTLTSVDQEFVCPDLPKRN
jgi:hypothetical protein